MGAPGHDAAGAGPPPPPGLGERGRRPQPGGGPLGLGGARRRARRGQPTTDPARRRRRAARRPAGVVRRRTAPPSRRPRGGPGGPGACTGSGSSQARCGRSGRTPPQGRPPPWPPTSGPPSPTPAERRASSPRPARARPGCSPSGPGCCSTAWRPAGRRRSAWSPSTGGRPTRWSSAPPTCPGSTMRTLNALGLAILDGRPPFRRRAGRRHDDARRAAGAPAPRRPGRSPAPGAGPTPTRWRPGWRRCRRSASACATRPRSRTTSSGDVDGLARRDRALPGRPGRSAASWTSTSRSSAPIEVLLAEPDTRAAPRSGPAGCCWSTSSRTSPPPTCC